MARLTIAARVAAPLLLLAGASLAWADAPAPKALESPAAIPTPEQDTASISMPDPVPPPDPIAAINQPDVAQCRRLGKVFFDLPPQQQSKSAGRLISCVEAVAGID
jgi:hypothetical protein